MKSDTPPRSRDDAATDTASQELRGADLLARTLRQCGVEVVFSLSGNQIMPVFDACLSEKIRIIHVRHEAAAVAMADAWGQLTGRPGVALVTAGPGFLNALSPLLSAGLAESPLVLLSGDSPVAADGRGAFQEMAQTDVSAPLTKLSLRPQNSGELGAALARAFSAALSGRPGPVHVALAADVLTGAAAASDIPSAEDCRRREKAPQADSLAPVLDALAMAERPLCLTGPALNSSRAGDLAACLEEALDLPVIAVESPRGKADPALGAFSDVLGEADTVLLLGKAADFTLGFLAAPPFHENVRILAIDPQPAALERIRRLAGDRLDAAVEADADLAAEALIASAGSKPGRSAWRQRTAEALAVRASAGDEAERIGPQHIAASLDALIGTCGEAVLIIDGGEFGQWIQAGTRAPTRIINGMSGAIGFCLPMAIAARIARPEADVFVAMGDGTAGFHFMELDTAVREDLPFVAVIGNDARWNAEHMIQLRQFGPERTFGCDLNPDCRYDRAAAALGCHGARVTERAGIAEALKEALESGRPAVVDIAMDGRPAPTVGGKAGGH